MAIQKKLGRYPTNVIQGPRHSWRILFSKITFVSYLYFLRHCNITRHTNDLHDLIKSSAYDNRGSGICLPRIPSDTCIYGSLQICYQTSCVSFTSEASLQSNVQPLPSRSNAEIYIHGRSSDTYCS